MKGEGDCLFKPCLLEEGQAVAALREILDWFVVPFPKGARVGVKVHWGERGNRSHLPPFFTREIVRWLKGGGFEPFVFDTTVLYSGGRRKGEEALETARRHGFSPGALGCPVTVADGLDGLAVVDIPAGWRHFPTVQVADVFSAGGFVVLSHFKGHMAAGFGGAIKNLSMGFASRAQKQRMHADARPFLNRGGCTRCGLCVRVCPSGAAVMEGEDYPSFDDGLCIGCAQCIGLCPEAALRIFWETDNGVFQEKLVETAAAVWRLMEGKAVFINALLRVTAECDCLPGENPVIAPDRGLLGGYHPVAVDRESLRIVGEEVFEGAHPGLSWRRQFTYASEIGFLPR